MAKNSPTQTQRIITALAASILVFYLWIFVYNKFFWTPPTTQPATATATAPEGSSVPPMAEATTAPASGTQGVARPTTQPASANGSLMVVGGSQTDAIKLGDASPGSAYPLALELTPEGAAVRSAWIRGHFETVKKDSPYRIIQPLAADSRNSERYSLVTSKIRFLDSEREVRLDSAIWKTESATDQQTVFSVVVNQPDGTALARVVKTYALPQQPKTKGPGGETFDLLLTTRIENLTDGPLRAVIVQQGPIGFQMESRTEDRKIIGAMYQKDRGNDPVVKGHLRTDLADKDLLELGRDESETRIAWVAEANQYFTCIMAPAQRQGFEEAARFERADAIHLTDTKDATSEDLTFRYVSSPLTIPVGQGQEVAFDCYIGPKSKAIFDAVEKYKQRNYYAVLTEGFYACAPTALVSLMMWLLNSFYRIPPHNYGIAIFLLVVLVRSILHPITKRSQVNMMKMQKQMSSLAPKINAVKEKYANDRTAMNQAIMEVYRDAGVNPAGNILTCIPMMLQLPIWAALWAALSSTVEMRHAPLDGWWIKDLTQPDGLFYFSEKGITIPLLGYIMGGPVHALNLLPILLAISQLLQAKYMPRSTAPSTSDNPDQMEQQRKMMMFMSIFFLFMFYNMPSGLNLYIMTSNIGGIIEQWRIRKHIAEEEERLKNLPPGTKPPQGVVGQAIEPLRGWFHSKWQNLQKEAEEVKKLQSEKPKKRK